MADYLGPFQNRVLEVKDRNIDNVVFQYKRPPLSSEWNLINQIGNEKIQGLIKSIYPSGWIYLDNIYEDCPEVDVPRGGVVCSSEYISNSFKLMPSIAIVNGWVIVVQGTNTNSSDNLIILNPPTGQFYDFVFLEVWRKLVGSEDPIFPYGNVLTNPFLDNEIKWDVIGCETTRRVQIQYRIRTVRILPSILDCTQEIFDLVDIHPIGGRDNGEAVLQKYKKYDSSDPGLYVAGDGTNGSKEYLNTVDGYVYAIPMFIVYRRKYSNNIFSSTRIDNSCVTKEKFSIGFRSDRPDGKIVDVIYKDDIVDLRHKVGNLDLNSIVSSTISKLISGELSTALKKGFDINGTFTSACSGGRELLKVERLNSIPGDNIPDIGATSSSLGSSFKRRAFCNSEIVNDHNIIEIPNVGVWTPGTFSISSRVILPPGEIISVDGFFSPDQGLVTGVTSDGVNITISNTGAHSIVGTTNRLYMEYTFKYYSSSVGFRDVPKEFLEINKDDRVLISPPNSRISIRFNNNEELLNFGASSGEVGYAGDISPQDYIENKGITYTDLFNSGHLLVLHRTTNNYGKVTINLTNSKYCQHYILGVKAVEVNGTFVSFTSERVINTIPNYRIESYIITVPSYSNTNVKIYLLTGSKFKNSYSDSYSLVDSVKFFDLSKQGRGIIDTYELIEAIAIESPIGSGDYYADTGDKPIIKIATISMTMGENIESIPFAYKYDISDTHILLSDSISINRKYPILRSSSYEKDYLPTKIKIKGPAGLEKLRVPIFVHSYVTSSEGIYNFFYKTIPYQGILNTTYNSIYGKIIESKEAIVTTLGSGAIKNYTYNKGTVSIVAGTRNVTGVGTSFTKYVKSGDYLRIQNSSLSYRIKEIVSDTVLILTESFIGSSVSNVSYEVTRMDTPTSNISNVVDRLPALFIDSGDRITDYKCYSDSVDSDTGVELKLVKPQMVLQDPIDCALNTFTLGSGTANRGRSNLEFGEEHFRLNYKKPYLIYEKLAELPIGHKKRICQFYLFVRSGKNYYNDGGITGRLYLLVITTENVNNAIDPYSDNIVDIYELVGRPIIRG